MDHLQLELPWRLTSGYSNPIADPEDEQRADDRLSSTFYPVVLNKPLARAENLLTGFDSANKDSTDKSGCNPLLGYIPENRASRCGRQQGNSLLSREDVAWLVFVKSKYFIAASPARK
jgi:hypothetical protein